MKRQLVFIPGRAQYHKDAAALKVEWLDALAEGLAKSGLTLPVTAADVRFPDYTTALREIVDGSDEAAVADVIIRRAAQDTVQQAFFAEVLDELRSREGIDMARLEAIAGPAVLERGPLSVEWLQGILAAVAACVPAVNSARIALTINDLYQYLHNVAFRQAINDDARRAIALGRATVVVSHSLGALIAYDLLSGDPRAGQWVIPLLVTLGAPLGINAIRKRLNPVTHPACVVHWFNAIDPQDAVALHPLSGSRFDIDPPIENKTDVANESANRHGLAGYLRDADVAARIHAALTG
jgi:hypothetical protein